MIIYQFYFGFEQSCTKKQTASHIAKRLAAYFCTEVMLCKGNG